MSAAECVLPEVQEGCDDLYSPAVEDDCEGVPSLRGTSAYELGLFTPACLCLGAVSEECMAATLQPGSSLVASGYCLYSSSTFFALTLGAGVQIFTLDPHIGEFVLTHPNVAVPQRGAIYSLNEAIYSLNVGRAAADVHRGPAGRQRRERRALHREVHWVDGWRRAPDAALRRHLWLPRRLKECKRQASPAVRGGADGIPGRAGGGARPDRGDTS